MTKGGGCAKIIVMKRRILAALCAILVTVAALPLFSGCSADVKYSLLEDDKGKYYEVGCTGFSFNLSGKLEIPAYFGEGESRAPVRAIAEEGFSGTEITSVTIPATVEKIGARAFSYCNSLTEVKFEEGISLETLSVGAFAYCLGLESITLPAGLKSVGTLSFIGCTALSEVTLPEGVTGIYAQAFESCSALKNISLPATLTTIGSQAFYYSGLEEVVVPVSVTDIKVEDGTDENGETKYKTTAGLGYSAFHSCLNLKLAVVEGNVEKILAGTFGYCPALESVYLPSSVKEIEGAYYKDGKFVYGHAFHNDGALKSINFAGTQEEWSAVKIGNEGVNYNDSHYDNSAVTSAVKHYGATYSK